jgi:hypothetical protein
MAFSRFGLTLPLNHMASVALATTAMAALLGAFPQAPSFVLLAGHITAGAAVYVAILALLYATTLLRILRLRQQRS